VTDESCFGCPAIHILIPAKVTDGDAVSRQKFCAECLAQFRTKFQQEILSGDVRIEVDFLRADVSRALDEFTGRLSGELKCQSKL
jgi:hypothetical protein